MGVTEFPCPKCGQAQRVRAPNGQEIKPRLCAACEEKERESQGSANTPNDKHEEEAGKKARAR